jgi:hypothetical protein
MLGLGGWLMFARGGGAAGTGTGVAPGGFGVWYICTGGRCTPPFWKPGAGGGGVTVEPEGPGTGVGVYPDDGGGRE